MDTPKKMKDITKEFMIDFIKERNNEKEKEWFINLVKSSKTTRKINNVEREITDINAIRREFAKKYFPEIKLNKKGNTYLDEVLKAFDK